MSIYRKAVVTGLSSWADGLKVAVLDFGEGEYGEGVVIENLVGDVGISDDVIVNTTAVELGLGSGGYHFILWNLSKDNLVIPSQGHIMKLRYTPLQINVPAVEELLEDPEDAGDISGVLEGIPVIAGSVHSQLLPAALAYKKESGGKRLTYIMTDGGALPIKFSKTVKFLQDNNYVDYTITCGHAFGGELEAVNIFGALVAAKRICNSDAVVVVMGPGIVGTNSAVGFSGMEQSTIVNAADSLGGKPIVIPRINFHDIRRRHKGISHHTLAVIKYGTRSRSIIPIPVMEHEKEEFVMAQVKEAGMEELHDIRIVDCGEHIEDIKCCGFQPTVMGRSVDVEPEYFMAAAAAGILAAEIGGD